MSKAFRESIVAPSSLKAADWATQNVRLVYGSALAPTFSTEMSPWVVEPMNEFFDNANKELVFLGPVGGGKTTMIEAMLCHIVAEDNGPTLVTGQTDSDVRDWAESRMWPVMRANEATSSQLPDRRDKIRKDAIMFDHMPLYLTGANMSGLQSKSIRFLIGDEAWMWSSGMIAEFRERMHRRWNGRRLLTGQASYVDDDYHRAFKAGELREWSFECPECGAVQPFIFKQLRWPEDGTNAERAAACKYHCAACDHGFTDDVQERRRLVESGRYVSKTPAAMPGHISFHFNVLTLWRAPWSDTVAAWLNAQDSLRRGDSTELEKLIQKQLAEFWDGDMSINRPAIDEFDGRVEDYANGEPIEDEVRRFMTIDCQRDHYWACVRAWRADASSVLLWYGRVSTEETLEELRTRYEVPSEHTYIDTGYDTGRIYDMICRFGWCGIRGDRARRFQHSRKGRKVDKLFSPIKTALAPCASRARYFFVATDPIKDILARLRGGEGAAWEVLEGVTKAYASQVDSEAREEFLAPKTNQPQSHWVKKKRDNHAWDCEVYQVAAALVWRLFGD